MAPQSLTTEQALLLQRFYDGDLSAAESVRAEQLVERSTAARVYVRALEELSAAARAAGALAWERAERAAISPQVLTEMAESAADLCEAPLADLAPLLERFHDGEADEAERACVTALLEVRDDAVDYLAGLDEIGQGMRVLGEEMVDEVDFGGFWDGIAAQIGDDRAGDRTGDRAEQACAAFDRDTHLVLLHRYVDDEVDADERALVEGWVAQGDAQVRDYLAALGEIELGVTAAIETACERAEVRDIWTGVSHALDDEARAEVVSLADEARKRGSQGSSDGGGWFGEYRQAIVGALAAAVVLAGLVGLFKDQLIGSQERVVVEKRVVYVEQVEYSPGSSVMIDSPVEQASMEAGGDESEDDDEPTVIWLFDNGDDAQGDAADTPAEKPAPAGPDAGPTGTDAGTRRAPQGQPI